MTPLGPDTGRGPEAHCFVVATFCFLQHFSCKTAERRVARTVFLGLADRFEHQVETDSRIKSPNYSSVTSLRAEMLRVASHRCFSHIYLVSSLELFLLGGSGSVGEKTP